ANASGGVPTSQPAQVNQSRGHGASAHRRGSNGGHVTRGAFAPGAFAHPTVLRAAPRPGHGEPAFRSPVSRDTEGDIEQGMIEMAATVDLAALAIGDFSPHLDAVFDMQTAAGVMPLKLAKVDPAGDSGRAGGA